jgi:phosphoglycolate phosphatase-like HAD superfamily hydrolase
MTLRCVLLDIDGTLIDSNHFHAESWRQAFSEFGYNVPMEHIRPLIGMRGDKLIIAIDPTLPEKGQIAKKIMEHRETIFLTKYANRVRPMQGARSLLEYLRNVGLTLTIASSSREKELSVLLKTTGIDDLLATSFPALEAKESKPSPDIILRGLEQSAARPDEAVMLGDTRYDIEAAARAFVPTIALRCGGSNDKELAGAYAVYDDPADILRDPRSLFSARYEQ